MAGIGFELKKSLSDETYSGIIKGYFSAAIIAAGPWMFAVVAINALAIYVRQFFTFKEFEFFNSLITYSFCFSLILFGVLDTVITRYLSDKLYFQERQVISSSFISIWIFVLSFLSMFGVPFYYFNDVDPFFKVFGLVFFLILGSTWLCMIFLSAARNYTPITWAFVLGGIIGVMGGKMIGELYGLKGAFFGFISGGAATLYILLLSIYREFSFKPIFTLEWLRYYRQFPQLILIGLVLNCGLWVDKIIFWFSKEDGNHVAGLFYSDIHYGSTLFLAYLSMIPTLTVFLVQIETSFYVYYKKFFEAIDAKKGLKDILKCKEELVDCLRKSIPPLLTIQGLITIVLVITAPLLLKALSFPSTNIAIFRIAVVGVALQAMTMIMGILLLYLLEVKKVVGVYFVFFLTNALLTKLTLMLGFPFWGFGFMCAGLISFLSMYFILDKQIQVLEFKTFFNQPLVAPKMYKTQAWEPADTLLTPADLKKAEAEAAGKEMIKATEEAKASEPSSHPKIDPKSEK